MAERASGSGRRVSVARPFYAKTAAERGSELPIHPIGARCLIQRRSSHGFAGISQLALWTGLSFRPWLVSRRNSAQVASRVIPMSGRKRGQQHPAFVTTGSTLFRDRLRCIHGLRQRRKRFPEELCRTAEYCVGFCLSQDCRAETETASTSISRQAFSH